MADHEARSTGRLRPRRRRATPAGRRRRQVADWGVGEEIFDHMPGRRFERRPAATASHEIPRGGADDGRRTIVIETDDELPPAAPLGGRRDEEFTSREEALRARQEHDELWGGDEPFAAARRAVAGRRADVRAERVRPAARQRRGRRGRTRRWSRRTAPRGSSAVARPGGARSRSAAGRVSCRHPLGRRRPPRTAARAARCAARPRRRVGVRARDPADPDRGRDRRHLGPPQSRQGETRFGSAAYTQL